MPEPLAIPAIRAPLTCANAVFDRVSVVRIAAAAASKRIRIELGLELGQRVQ